MKDKLKPRKDEIWEVEAPYAWGQCLVKVIDIDPSAVVSFILDAETWANMDYAWGTQKKGPKEYWCFPINKFIRRIEPATRGTK